MSCFVRWFDCVGLPFVSGASVLKAPNAILVNASKATVLVLGSISAAALQGALAGLVAPSVAAQTSSAAVVVQSALAVSGHAGLVVGAAAGSPLLWGRKGLSAVWPRANEPLTANLWQPPCCAFLVAKDTTGALPAIAALTPAQARVHFAVGGYAGATAPADTAAMAERFGKLVAVLVSLLLCLLAVSPLHNCLVFVPPGCVCVCVCV